MPSADAVVSLAGAVGLHGLQQGQQQNSDLCGGAAASACRVQRTEWQSGGRNELSCSQDSLLLPPSSPCLPSDRRHNTTNNNSNKHLAATSLGTRGLVTPSPLTPPPPPPPIRRIGTARPHARECAAHAAGAEREPGATQLGAAGRRAGRGRAAAARSHCCLSPRAVKSHSRPGGMLWYGDGEGEGEREEMEGGGRIRPGCVVFPTCAETCSISDRGQKGPAEAPRPQSAAYLRRGSKNGPPSHPQKVGEQHGGCLS